MAAVRDRQPLIGDGVPGLLYVGVELDAMNEMGATQRGSNVCNFSMKDGKVIGREVEDLVRSEAHTSELQSLMRISYAVFYLTNTMTKRNVIAIPTQAHMHTRHNTTTP